MIKSNRRNLFDWYFILLILEINKIQIIFTIKILMLNKYIIAFMSTEKSSKKDQKPAYEIKETPLLKKLFNKIFGPIRFF